jgi:starvation-inducible DNA-binding protein
MTKSKTNLTEAPKMYETENDISQGRRVELSLLLNQRLADAVDLQMQMKQAHWNVKGPSFIALHELFDKVDEAIESYVDKIAERIVQLGGIAEGTVRVAASRSRLAEYPLRIAEGTAHVEAVARALSTFGHEIRNTIDEANALEDAGTADLFTEILRGTDQWLWFVEAHSQANK